MESDSSNHISKWEMRLNPYAWVGLINNNREDLAASTVAHETGHALGLLDLYNIINGQGQIMFGYGDLDRAITDEDVMGAKVCREIHNHTFSTTLSAADEIKHGYPCIASPSCNGYYQLANHNYQYYTPCVDKCYACNLAIDDHDWVHATCTDYAFCNNCQLINQSSPPLGHMLSAYQHNATQHWKECSRPICSSPIVGLANHGNYYYTKINDTSHAKICGTNCGDSVTLNHNWSSAYQSNTSQHWYPCIQNCGADNSKANHSNAYYYYNSFQHKYGCLTCNYVQSTSDHTYGSPQQYNYAMHIRTCTASGCGTNIYQSHSWSYGSYNSSQHYQSCSCGYGAWVDHSGSYCPCGYSPPPGCPPHDCYFVNHYQYTQSTCYIMQYECSNCTYVDNDLTMVGGHSPPPDYSWGDYTCLDCGMTVWG